MPNQTMTNKNIESSQAHPASSNQTMANKSTDSSQGDGGNPPPVPGPPGPPGSTDRSRSGNKVYKSGPLFLSSKGIGWTSWKKRWFILTRTSLVFFRSDPNAVSQKGSEVNLTLGGIDLNSSGSVVVKADKKLLTVLFPDGRDGRAFTLKAETLEDLHEWKAALEEALANAPSAALVMGQNGIFKNDQADATDGSLEQSKDRYPVKSLVIGRPILLALEDIDGTPSFLEKALRFVEEHGVRVEGILRQAADVEDVEHRIREYEHGNFEFSPDEDPHVIADCVKYVLRELPSSPVPASCCNALLEAYRTDRGNRINTMRGAICETFPEPNRKLLQRILLMMQTVASHKAENRMSTSAVAACMAPLLLRPLLAGDCELENDFAMGGDSSVQLLKAAAAANHAQAIVITLLEEYDNLFGEGSTSPELYSDSEESGSESEELSDDDETFEDDEDDDAPDGSDADLDDDFEHASNGTCSETGESGDNDLSDHKGSEGFSPGSKTPRIHDDLEAGQKLLSIPFQVLLPHHNNVEGNESFQNQSNKDLTVQPNEFHDLLRDAPVEKCSIDALTDKSPSKSVLKPTTPSDGRSRSIRPPTFWGRAPGRKNLSMESIEFPCEEEAEIQRLEATKTDLQNQIAEEARGNAILHESLEKHKKALHERRLALEQDVARLQEQLQKERELRTVLEAGLKMPQGPLPVSVNIDEKMKAELEEIAKTEADIIKLKQKADDIGEQLNQQREQNYGHVHGSCKQPLQTPNYQGKLKDKQKVSDGTTTPHTHEKLTRSKQDTHLGKADGDRDIKGESPSFSNKHPLQDLWPDLVLNSRSLGTLATVSSLEPVMSRPVSTNSRRSGTRGEGANSTTSALSKLTNRLNFLKERRSQITNELQNLDKGRNSGRSMQSPETGRGFESSQLSQNTDKFQGSEGQSPGRGSETYESLENPDKGIAIEGSSVQNTEKFRKTDGKSVQNLDIGKSEAPTIGNLDRGKSETFLPGEKGRSSFPSRKLSR